tara:strand:+ start:3619 stop:4668 length:1050 start_codon:yes stop_codon:yes gene_type:complete
MENNLVIKIDPDKFEKKPLKNFKIVHEPEEIKKPPGLINYGNTCFFNTGLQILLTSSRFCNFINKDHNPDQVQEEPVSKSINCIREILTNKDDIGNSQKTLCDIIGSKRPEYNSGLQQDCHECMIYLIDFLNTGTMKKEEPERVKRKVSLGKEHSEIMKAFGNFYWDEHTYRMQYGIKSFHGLYHSSTTCSVCKTENNRWDLFNNVSLMVTHKNFKDWLGDFCKEEVLEGYECEKCGQRQNAIRQIEVWRYPKTLILHSIGKTFKNISTEIVVKEPVHNNCKFVLQSIGFHSGASLHSGHYYCCVNRNSKWWFISDENVSGPIDPFKELPSHINNSYILLYERVSKNMD